MKDYDFCGYATRNNIRCSDGRTIMKNAFADDDGKRVPLVWNHQHNDPTNVLGHADLENREDGVFAYAKFNDTESGQNAKQLVLHGDISALSIFANKLQEQSGRVMHGIIREVSLVLAGANPGATIDSFVAHNDDGLVVEDRTQGCFYSGLEGELYHADDSDKEDDEDKQEKEAPEKSEGRTVEDVMKTFTDEQKVVIKALLETAIQKDSDDEESSDDDDNDEEESEVKHNVFDTETTPEENYISHADEMAIVKNAKNPAIGTLKGAIAAYCEEKGLEHGFDTASTTFLLPEYKDLKGGAPEMLTDDQGWISKVLQKVHKSPMTRIRTRFTDIRNIENLRAKGYKQKGDRKVLTGDYSVLYRTTDAQTVYVRSSLHRDDVLDITDFDVVQYQYNIDKMMLNEELATAILLGDGRDDGDQYRIDPTKIRPVWTDDELYTIHRTVDFAAIKEQLQGTNTGAYFGEGFVYAEAFIQELLYGREDAKNLGQGDLYITPHALNKMLLARDMNGRRIYNTVEELRSALNVGSIITVEQFEGKQRSVTVEGATKKKNLLGMVVNLNNYYLGCNKGGEITHFTDFDINFNTLESLLETRCSGSNTRPFSALVLEEDVA
jgi:HK97 family phage prohead protease